MAAHRSQATAHVTCLFGAIDMRSVPLNTLLVRRMIRKLTYGAAFSYRSIISAGFTKNRPRGDAKHGLTKPLLRRAIAGALQGELRVIRAAHSPAISQLKNLIRQRHFDIGVAEMRCELAHDIFFAVDEKRTLCTGLLLPSQQFGFVGMG